MSLFQVILKSQLWPISMWIRCKISDFKLTVTSECILALWKWFWECKATIIMLARGLGIVVASKNEKRGPQMQQLSDPLKLLMFCLEICEQSNSNGNSSNANLPFYLSLKLFYSRFVVEKIYQQRNQQITKLGVHCLFS